MLREVVRYSKGTGKFSSFGELWQKYKITAVVGRKILGHKTSKLGDSKFMC